jgi:hypothetical protein
MNETEIDETKPGLVEKIGNGISSVLKNSELIQEMLPLLLVLLPPPYDQIVLVVLQVVASAMGVDENPEQLGYQMNLSDKGPEDDDFNGSFKEFKDYLDQNFPFDQAKFDQMTPDEKMTCRYVGVAGTMSELKESAGFAITPETLGFLAKGAARLGWDSETVAAFSRGLSKDRNGSDSFDSISDAVNGKLDPGKFDATMDFIDAGMKETGTGKSAEDFIEAARLGD